MAQIDEELLHTIADEVIVHGSFEHVDAAEVDASVAFAKSSDWEPEGGYEIPGTGAIMNNPQVWVGYGVLIGLEAARRSS